MKRLTLSALTVLLLAMPPLLEAQTVTGTVRDQAGNPLASVQVFIAGTSIGVLSQNSGRYLLLNVPVGTHTITAQLLGYREATADVTVAAGQAVVQDLVMSEQALQLDEIVVTGTASGARIREIGNSVAIIDASIAEIQPLLSLTDLLRGRVAGVVIQQGSGMAGAASAIRIRGSSTMREVNQGPLLYIDGVRVNNRMENGTRDVSRFDDLDPQMIESITIIKGPAAATLYGTEAANGVIQIITKRGRAGAAVWNFTMRQGSAWFADPAGHTPTNWAVSGISGNIESLNILENQAESDLMFRNAHNQYYGIDVSGGTAAFQYFISGTASSDEGATFNSWSKRYNGRINISAQPSDNMTVSANMGIGLIRMRLAGDYPYEDAVRSSPNRLGLTPDRRGYDRRPPEAWLEKEQDFHEANRMTAGVTINHTPSDWFSHRFTFGVDVTDQLETRLDAFLTPQTAPFWGANAALGAKFSSRDAVVYTTLDYGASATRSVSDNLVSTTSAGFQVYTKSIKNVNASGSGFPALGLATIGATGSRTGSERLTENNTVGVYVQQQIGWKDRLFLVGAVRADDNSAFGENFDLVYYPKLSASWVVSEEDFWGDNFITSLRFRAAYGESGQQPDAFDALRSYTTRSSPGGAATVTPDAPGNSELGPERGVEFETGFDASFFNDRITLDFTYYNQTTKDAIVARDVAPSLGFTDRQFVNIGQISNTGIEVGLNARIIEARSFDWDLGVNFSTNNNNVDVLGLDGSFLQTGWTSRHTEGYPAGSMWAPDVIFAEFITGTEIIDPDTMRCDDGNGQPVVCDEDSWIYQGHPDPNFDGYLTTSITIGDRLTIDALVQGRFGQTKYDLQGWWRYSSRQQARLNLYPLEHDDITEVAEAQYGSSGEFDLWVNSASFIRWKELSLSYLIPDSWAQKIGTSRGTVSLSSRNLAMLWTNWPEWPHHDPEITDATATFTQEPQEDAGIPPLMSLTLTVRLTR